MSLKLLTENSKKSWLNPRVNNLKLDGIIEPNLNNGYVYDALNTIGQSVPDGGYSNLKQITLGGSQYRTTIYEVASALEVNFVSVASSLTAIRFVVHNNETATDFYVGNPNVISGINGDKKTLALLDSRAVPSQITKDFELRLQIETTAPAGQEPSVSGTTIFKSVAQS
jgi:hypothetical protein